MKPNGNSDSALVDWYEENVAAPNSADEAYGYWAFVVGSVLADSGEGYSSRSKAKQGVESVRTNAPLTAVNEATAES